MVLFAITPGQFPNLAVRGAASGRSRMGLRLFTGAVAPREFQVLFPSALFCIQWHGPVDRAQLELAVCGHWSEGAGQPAVLRVHLNFAKIRDKGPAAIQCARRTSMQHEWQIAAGFSGNSV